MCHKTLSIVNPLAYLQHLEEGTRHILKRFSIVQVLERVVKPFKNLTDPFFEMLKVSQWVNYGQRFMTRSSNTYLLSKLMSRDG